MQGPAPAFCWFGFIATQLCGWSAFIAWRSKTVGPVTSRLSAQAVRIARGRQFLNFVGSLGILAFLTNVVFLVLLLKAEARRPAPIDTFDPVAYFGFDLMPLLQIFGWIAACVARSTIPGKIALGVGALSLLAVCCGLGPGAGGGHSWPPPH
jgi:hypothetical protein